MQKAPPLMLLLAPKRQVTDPPFTSALHINGATVEMNMPSPSTPLTSLQAFYRAARIVPTLFFFFFFGCETGGAKSRTSYLLLAAVEIKWNSSQTRRIHWLQMNHRRYPAMFVVLAKLDFWRWKFVISITHTKSSTVGSTVPTVPQQTGHMPISNFRSYFKHHLCCFLHFWHVIGFFVHLCSRTIWNKLIIQTWAPLATTSGAADT